MHRPTVQEQLKNTEEKKNDKDLSHLVELCREGLALLQGRDRTPCFATLESW